MILTVNRKFEFCASHRLAVPGWSEAENEAAFAQEALGRFGHGHNYERIWVGGVTYLVAGLGGAAKHYGVKPDLMTVGKLNFYGCRSDSGM